MTSEIENLLIEDMQIEDDLDLMIPEAIQEAIDTLLAYDSETNSYDPDSGLLFPPEIKDYNIYYESNPFLYKIYYTIENQSKKLLTVIESSRIIHIYTIIFSIDDLNDITDIADVFIR